MAGQIENEIKIKIARTKTRTIAVKKRGDHEFSISPATARSVVIAYCGHSAEFGHTVSYPLGMLVLGLGLAWPGLALRTISIGLGLGLIGQCLGLVNLGLGLASLGLSLP